MPNTIQQNIGQRIRTLRKRRGLTQLELANRCRLHWTYIGGLERGERNPTLTTMLRVANGLAVGLNKLIDTRALPPTPALEQPKEARLLRLMRKKGGESMDLASKLVREVLRWQDRYVARKK